MTKKKKNSLALWSLVVAGGSYIAGRLTAPKSGKESREDINKAAQKAKKEAETLLKKAHSELNELVDTAKKNGQKGKKKVDAELKEVIDTAEDVKKKAREILSAVHEGEADNKDLNKAVADAKKSIKNLKTYLKK